MDAPGCIPSSAAATTGKVLKHLISANKVLADSTLPVATVRS